MSPSALDDALGPTFEGLALLGLLAAAAMLTSMAMIETAFWITDWRRKRRRR